MQHQSLASLRRARQSPLCCLMPRRRCARSRSGSEYRGNPGRSPEKRSALRRQLAARTSPLSMSRRSHLSCLTRWVQARPQTSTRPRTKPRASVEGSLVTIGRPAWWPFRTAGRIDRWSAHAVRRIRRSDTRAGPSTPSVAPIAFLARTGRRLAAAWPESPAAVVLAEEQWPPARCVAPGQREADRRSCKSCRLQLQASRNVGVFAPMRTHRRAAQRR